MMTASVLTRGFYCRSEHGPKQEFTNAAAEYSSRGRCGISDISGGVEGYLVPPSDLADRLIKTAYLAEGRDLRRESDGLPEELGTDQMLLLLVHLKVCQVHSSILSCCKMSQGSEASLVTEICPNCSGRCLISSQWASNEVMLTSQLLCRVIGILVVCQAGRSSRVCLSPFQDSSDVQILLASMPSNQAAF